jgi:DNA-binding transcriptional ArsR family regulator
MPGQRTVQLTNPRALRALAHPIRLELISLLRRGGPLTATQAGERIDESPSSCSFHLRQLAKYGLVEEAGGGHGRERPWRATAISTEWAARGSDDEADAATALLEPYLKRLEAREPPREGARPVSVIALAFPLPEEAQGTS